MYDPRLQSTSEEIASGTAISRTMLQDLLNVAAIPQTTCSTIAKSIEALEGLVNEEVLTAQVTKSGVEHSTVESVVRAVKIVNYRTVQAFIERIAEWVARSDDRKSLFTPVVFQNLGDNLRVLTKENSSIELMRKAEILLHEVGNEVKEVKFICDIRPVFDEPREIIKGFVLVTTIRMVYQMQHGDFQNIEFALSEGEIDQLEQSIQIAKKKLEAMKAVCINLKIGDE